VSPKVRLCLTKFSKVSFSQPRRSFCQPRNTQKTKKTFSWFGFVESCKNHWFDRQIFVCFVYFVVEFRLKKK